MTTIHPSLLLPPVRQTHDTRYRPPTLEQALNWQINESSRGVRMVALRDMTTARLEDLAAASERHQEWYKVSTFRWQGEAARLVLKHRKSGEVPLL